MPAENGLEAHPASYATASVTGSFLGVKELQSGAEHPTNFNTEVASGLKVFLRPSSVPE